MMAEDILWEIEFNRYIENQKREGIDEGKAIGEKRGLEKGIALGKKNGLEKGKLVTLISLVKEGLLPLDQKASCLLFLYSLLLCSFLLGE